MILLTGGSGFLGKELLGRLLISRPHESIGLLLRDSADCKAVDRTDKILQSIFGQCATNYADRVIPIAGDISEPQFGLGETDFKQLAARTNEVFHSAATTKLNEEPEIAQSVNVGGTAHVLELARLAANTHADFVLHHISTAYVAGSTERVVLPSELQTEGPFRNAYEQSKAVSEAAVLSHKELFSVRVYRPSVIVGDSVTGETSAFNVLYVPVRFMLKGLFKALPVHPHIPFDVVPVDYVADAITELSQLDLPPGKTFHLTAGLGRESNPREIIEIVFACFNLYFKHHVRAPMFVPQELLQRALIAAERGLLQLEKLVCNHLGVFKQTLPFIPYMLSNPRFDASETERYLSNRLLPPPLFSMYAERIFTYCFETNWGKRPWENSRNLSTWYARLQAQTA